MFTGLSASQFLSSFTLPRTGLIFYARPIDRVWDDDVTWDDAAIWDESSFADTIGLSANALWDALPAYMRSIYLSDRDTKRSSDAIIANIQASGFLNVGGGLHGNSIKGYAQYSTSATTEINEKAARYFRSVYGLQEDIKSLFVASGGELSTLAGPAHATSYTGAFTMPDGSTKTVPVDSTKGLWVGPGYTNSVSNSKAVGAVVGTPGIPPTGWDRNSGNGITVDIAGTGDGYVDVRFHGTQTSSATQRISPSSNVAITASASQSWNFFISAEIISGDLTGITAVNLGVYFRTALGGYLGESTVPVTLPISEYPKSVTTIASTERVQPFVSMTIQNGIAVDCTIRISKPQLTQTAYKMPYIPTAGTAITNPSAVGTSGGNGASWPLTGSDSAERLIECFRGVPDGVELTSNTSPVIIDSDANGIPNTFLTYGFGTMVGTREFSNGIMKFTVISAGTGRIGINKSSIYSIGNRVLFSVRAKGKGTFFVGDGIAASSTTHTLTGDFKYFYFEAVIGQAEFYIGINGTNTNDYIEISSVSIQKLSPAVFTVGALCYMGSSGANTPTNNNIITNTDAALGLMYQSGDTESDWLKSYDGTTGPNNSCGSWARDEAHLKLVQSKSDGSQFRVGNKRIGIDSAIQWGSWANFDGSFNPLTAIRLAYTGVIPLHIKGMFVSNKSMSDTEIDTQYNLLKV